MKYAVGILATVALLSVAVEAGEPARPPLIGDVQHIVFLTPSTPLFIRLHLRIGNRGFREYRRDWVDALFKKCDIDGDGRLDAAESARLPDLNALLATPVVGRRTGVTQQQEKSKGPERFSSAQHFADYLDQVVTPFVLTSQSAVVGPVVGEEMFVLLDQDRDGMLGKSDFTFGTNLRKLDLDDDESLSAAEMSALQNPFVRANPGMVNASRNSANLEQSDGSEFREIDQSASLAHALIQRYDRSVEPNRVPEQGFADGMLGPDELGIAEGDFSTYDRDGNQQLDFDELMQFLRDPVPDLEAVVWLEGLSVSRAHIDWLPAHNALSATVTKDGLLTRSGGSGLIVSVANPSNSNPSVVVATAKRFFLTADIDKNGYLELPEASGSNYFRGRFELMDRDGDKKVYEEEMLFIVEQQAAIQASRVFATVSDTGRNLFQMVDANRDGRVDGSELADAARLFPMWDHDGDGSLAFRDIPRAWRLVISRGQPLAEVGLAAGRAGTTSTEPNTAAARGPGGFNEWIATRTNG